MVLAQTFRLTHRCWSAATASGSNPAVVSRKINAEQIPADVRRAIKARDRRDRFPGTKTHRPSAHAQLDSGHDLNTGKPPTGVALTSPHRDAPASTRGDVCLT